MLLALLLVCVVAVVAGGLWMDSSLHRIPALADYPERPAAGLRYDVAARRVRQPAST